MRTSMRDLVTKCGPARLARVLSREDRLRTLAERGMGDQSGSRSIAGPGEGIADCSIAFARALPAGFTASDDAWSSYEDVLREFGLKP